MPPHLSESVRGADHAVRHIKGEADEVVLCMGTAVRGYLKEDRDAGGACPKGARPASGLPLILGA